MQVNMAIKGSMIFTKSSKHVGISYNNFNIDLGKILPTFVSGNGLTYIGFKTSFTNKI